MDITPLIRSDAKVIQGYGAHGIKVSGTLYEKPILVYTNRVEEQSIESVEDLDQEFFEGLKDLDVLIIGTGSTQVFLSKEQKAFLKSVSIVCETMNTGAACRTYNVLLVEDRRVAALLFVPKD